MFSRDVMITVKIALKMGAKDAKAFCNSSTCSVQIVYLGLASTQVPKLVNHVLVFV